MIFFKIFNQYTTWYYSIIINTTNTCKFKFVKYNSINKLIPHRNALRIDISKH